MQMLYQQQHILEFFHQRRLVHPEIDLTSVVVVHLTKDKAELRVMPSALMQRVSSASSAAALPVTPAGGWCAGQGRVGC
jgi:hypothetical protein